MFSRQIEALARPNDILFSISNSGDSPYIIEGIKTANIFKVNTLSLLVKSRGGAENHSEHPIIIPTNNCKDKINAHNHRSYNMIDS